MHLAHNVVGGHTDVGTRLTGIVTMSSCDSCMSRLLVESHDCIDQQHTATHAGSAFAAYLPIRAAFLAHLKRAILGRESYIRGTAD